MAATLERSADHRKEIAAGTHHGPFEMWIRGHKINHRFKAADGARITGEESALGENDFGIERLIEETCLDEGGGGTNRTDVP
jgi:hypothetical protein